jgi:acyl carrier protein
MNKSLHMEIRNIILSSLGNHIALEDLTDDYRLVGNILDSMAVTNLILAIEEYFNFIFDDKELSADHFETVGSLTILVSRKINNDVIE